MNFFEITLNLRKRILYSKCNSKFKHQVKFNIYAKIIFFFNLYLNSFGLQIEKIELSKFTKEIKIEYDDTNLSIEQKKICYKYFKNKFIINDNEYQNLNDRIYTHQKALDKSNISNTAYGQFRKIMFNNFNNNLLSLNKILIMRKTMNNFFSIKKNDYGCFVDCSSKINFVLKNIYEELEKNIENNIFKIHLCGDGCSLTRTKFSIVNFCFKVLNQNNDKSSGLFTLGIFNVKEEYQSLKIAFKEIISDLEKIKTVAIDGIIFEIEWSLGGDLKWLATVQGINSANSNQPCLWCMWHKNDISEKKWSINERSIRKAKFKSNKKKKGGYKNLPLLEFIEFNMIVIDPTSIR